MPDFTKKPTGDTIRRPGSARGAVIAVKMPESLTAEVDAWAEAHDMIRADAICRLIEIGLGSRPGREAHPTNPIELEDLAVRQISRLLDPSLPLDERDRRIRRLIEGPAEFSAQRIDLPKPRK